MRALPLLIIMAIIFVLSHTPGDQLPDSPGGWDKVLHTIAYLTLGLAALFAAQQQYKNSPLKISILVVLFCLTYGITDEFHQYFIPMREPSALDLIADTIGGFCAVLLWPILTPYLLAHKKSDLPS